MKEITSGLCLGPAKPAGSTIYACVLEGAKGAEDVPKDMNDPSLFWRPWVGCGAPDEMLARMVTNRHIRDRGGYLPGDLPASMVVLLWDKPRRLVRHFTIVVKERVDL